MLSTETHSLLNSLVPRASHSYGSLHSKAFQKGQLTQGEGLVGHLSRTPGWSNLGGLIWRCGTAGASSVRQLASSGRVRAVAASGEQIALSPPTMDPSLPTPAPLTAERGNDLLELGTFGSPHGVKGYIKFYALTDAPLERLNAPGTKYVQPQRKGSLQRLSKARPVEVERSRSILVKGREVWLVKVRGVDTPEEAEAFKAQCLMMSANDRPPLHDDEEFYVQELVGMQVIMQETGQAVGTVTDLYDGTGTYDTLRVRLSDESGSGEGASTSNRTILLPFAAEMVPVVDRQARRMEITPPAGLLDIVTSQEKKKRDIRRRPPARKPNGNDAVSGLESKM